MPLDCIAENAPVLMVLIGFFGGALFGVLIGAALAD
jgi:hypothetical protein